MSNRRCPKCGEEYSDTYRSCPFCEEEEAIKRGHPLRRHGGRRVEKRQKARSGGAGGVMLLLTGLIILGVVGYVFFGDDVAEAVGIRDTPEPAPVSGQDDKIPAQTDYTLPESPSKENPAEDSPTEGNPTEAPDGNEPAPPAGPVGDDAPDQTDEPSAPAEPLALSQTDITIPAGETGRLTATGGSGDITWTSSNPEIASVDGGAVTGKAGGTVTITAASGGETATCQVKVEGEPWVNPDAASYKLSKTDFTLSSSESSWQLKMKRDDGWEIVGPDDGVVWATNNPNVATISETGLVQRAGKGTTQVTATVGGVTMECIVRMA